MRLKRKKRGIGTAPTDPGVILLFNQKKANIEEHTYASLNLPFLRFRTILRPNPGREKLRVSYPFPFVQMCSWHPRQREKGKIST
jgi:hypothetical protein